MKTQNLTYKIFSRAALPVFLVAVILSGAAFAGNVSACHVAFNRPDSDNNLPTDSNGKYCSGYYGDDGNWYAQYSVNFYGEGEQGELTVTQLTDDDGYACYATRKDATQALAKARREGLCH